MYISNVRNEGPTNGPSSHHPKNEGAKSSSILDRNTMRTVWRMPHGILKAMGNEMRARKLDARREQLSDTNVR